MNVKLCQICHRPHDGKYGSGRFCSVQCAAKSRKINRAKTIAKKKRLGSYRNNFEPTTSKLQNHIVKLLRRAGIQCQTQYKVGKYYFDIKIGNKLIEINGSYWHANPKEYKATDIIKYPGKKRTLAMNVWKKDLKKKLQAQKRGYKVFYLWQDQINNSSQNALLKRILQNINSNNS